MQTILFCSLSRSNLKNLKQRMISFLFLFNLKNPLSWLYATLLYNSALTRKTLSSKNSTRETKNSTRETRCKNKVYRIEHSSFYSLIFWNFLLTCFIYFQLVLLERIQSREKRARTCNKWFSKRSLLYIFTYSQLNILKRYKKNKEKINASVTSPN